MSGRGMLYCPRCGSTYYRDQWSEAELLSGTPLCFDCLQDEQGGPVVLLAISGRPKKLLKPTRSAPGAQKRQKVKAAPRRGVAV